MNKFGCALRSAVPAKDSDAKCHEVEARVTVRLRVRVRAVARAAHEVEDELAKGDTLRVAGLAHFRRLEHAACPKSSQVKCPHEIQPETIRATGTGAGTGSGTGTDTGAAKALGSVRALAYTTAAGF